MAKINFLKITFLNRKSKEDVLRNAKKLGEIQDNKNVEMKRYLFKKERSEEAWRKYDEK